MEHRPFMCYNCDKVFVISGKEKLLQWHGHPFCSEKCVIDFAKKEREKQLMSNSYIMLNGEKVELTDTQVEELKAALKEPEKPKSPFDKVKSQEIFYSCCALEVEPYKNVEAIGSLSEALYNKVNYFNDEAFAQQVFLHQLLYRKLLKFAYEKDCVDKANWDGLTKHYFISYRTELDSYDATYCFDIKLPTVYFSSICGANQAIEEVLKPFIKEHPEFKW